MSSIEMKLDVWKSRLLDLSRRNRLLYLKPTRRSYVQIVEPGADDLFAALVNEGRKLQFLPRIEPAVAPPIPPPAKESVSDNSIEQATAQPAETDMPAPIPVEIAPLDSVPPESIPSAESESQNLVEPEIATSVETVTPTTSSKPPTNARKFLRTTLTESPLTNALYNLRGRAHTALEEQGVNVLFLSFGVLHWKDESNESVMSPLLLVPVQLERTSITQPFTLHARDEDILLNPTLAHKLQLDFHIALPRLPDEAEGLTPSAVFASIRQGLSELPTWTISPDVYLGLYSFEKLVIFKDLEAHTAEILAHPLLQAIAGDTTPLPPPPADLPRAEELDDKTQPLQTFQVLDADSSQQTAIEWSKRGVSFVIEGPPGTGKSQTISNIIAEALAQNKKVLFVSAKMAALEVVYKRLAECELGNFCLEAHSHRASRGAIVSGIGNALYETYPAMQPALDHLTRLADVREQLNKHARTLHTPVLPLQRTPFEIQCELATLDETPTLMFDPPPLVELDARRIQEISEGLDKLNALSVVWENYETHPWRGVALEAYSFKTRTDIEYRFGELMQLITSLEAASAQAADALALPAPLSLHHIVRLQRIAQYARQTPVPPSDWFRAGQTTELRHLALDAQAKMQEYKREWADFSAHYNESLLEHADLSEMLTRLEAVQSNVLRILDSKYREDLRVLRRAAKQGHAVNDAEAIRTLEQVIALQALRAWLNEHEAEQRARLGRMFNGLDTRWEDLFAALDWVEAITALFEDEPIPEQFIHLVCNRPARLEAVKPLLNDLNALLERLQRNWQFLEQLFPTKTLELLAIPLAELKAWLGLKLNHMDDLESWILFEQASRELERLGLSAFLQAAHAAKLEGDQLKPAFVKRFYHVWLDAVYAENPTLRVSGDLLQKTVAQFWRDDLEQLPIARERLVTHLAQQRPSALWVDAPSSEVTMLKREMVKRKHHKSIRRLFAEIPNLLLALKPCLMMSPLSVSQYLASAPIQFDMVIFDEASQIPPEDAVGAIVRSKQVIVAGDHQQLPPTPFFRSLGADEGDEEIWMTEGVMESLLQETTIVLPSVRLLWHYRSRHEALLAFSNHHFYKDRLVTFPNAALHDPHLGVEFVHVPDGIYDRAKTRMNGIEARRVAQLVFEHFQHSPNRTLGVVAFSQAQRAAIDLELQNLVRAQASEEFDAWLDSPSFFCKSLENVQGDEADVIFFSVGYGKDANGTMTLNFGPLNGEDGARRLNVAVTRAREYVKLISSILPSDLDTARNTSQGVQLLREYMEYAMRHARGQVSFGASTSVRAEEVALIASIERALRARGLTVHTLVGTGNERIDLAIVDAENPERYVLGIELDGATFRNAKTARERERLRAQVLEGLGWRMYRLRSRDWITNPTEQVERILQMLSSLETPAHAWAWPPRPNGDEKQESALASKNGNVAPVPSGIAEYVEASLPKQGTPEQFYRADERTFEPLFVQLAEEEGPVHWHTAARRIAACWGIPRVTPTVEQHLDTVLSKLLERQVVALRDDFLWSAMPTQVLVRQPRAGQEPRPIEEIALEEIAQAEFLNLQNALSLTEDDLFSQTARLLGYPRAGERVKRRLQTALARLEETGRVKWSTGKLEVGTIQVGAR